MENDLGFFSEISTHPNGGGGFMYASNISTYTPYTASAPAYTTTTGTSVMRLPSDITLSGELRILQQTVEELRDELRKVSERLGNVDKKDNVVEHRKIAIT